MGAMRNTTSHSALVATWRRAVLLLAAWAPLCLATLAPLCLAGERAVVEPLGPDAMAAVIDREIDARLAAEKVASSGRSDDAEFLRRIYLDVTGLLPHPEIVRGFLAAKNSDKRTRLIDGLIDDAAYARRLADLWDDILVTRNSDNKEVAIEPLTRWLESGFYYDAPWNEMARRLIAARGAQRDNPAVTIYMTEQRPLAPQAATDMVGRAFLGVRLNCAQCHDHPFAAWKHKDYWGMAAFFENLDFTKRFGSGEKASPFTGVAVGGGSGEGALDSAAMRRSGVSGAMRMESARRREKSRGGSRYGIRESPNPKPPDLPDRALAEAPRFLTGETPDFEDGDARLPALAEWVTSRENPWFARAMVNRVWSECFGRGLVEPVDDMHEGNSASHPELLEKLTEQFVAHDYSVKFLYRAICRSRAYQRTSRPVDGNREAEAELLARMNVKVLSGEELFDALFVLLGPEAAAPKGDLQKERQRLVEFLASDGEPDRLSYTHGIPQLLKLMNDKGYQKGLTRRIEKMGAGRREPREVIEALYLSTLSRPPSERESQRALSLVAKRRGDRDEAYASVLWALLNSSEFLLNR